MSTDQLDEDIQDEVNDLHRKIGLVANEHEVNMDLVKDLVFDRINYKLKKQKLGDDE